MSGESKGEGVSMGVNVSGESKGEGVSGGSEREWREKG